MCSPCASGHSPELIAMLANYRPLAPDPVPSPSMDPALIKYRQLSHSGTREYWNITVKNMHWPYSSYSIKWVIYCSKLNQRLISDLRSETSDGQQLSKYREDSDTPSWCRGDMMRVSRWIQSSPPHSGAHLVSPSRPSNIPIKISLLLQN